jgi:hypothetical protein
MVLAATAVMGVCMAMMPQKVEAGQVRHYVQHRDIYYPNGGERGVTGGYYNPWLGRVFTTNRYHYYLSDWLGNVKQGTYYAGASMNCGSRDLHYVNVPWYPQIFYFYPPNR